MAKDLVYVFDKINNRSSLLGEIQSDFNMSSVIDGTKDSTTIIVWSNSGVEIEPWSIVLHEKTMTWWCVSHDKVERYQNDDGSFVWLHNLELNGAFELLNARDLTDCGFNDRTYTVSDFIHRLFKLSNIEYTLTINAETNFLNKQVDFIKTFENYTLSSALREFLDAYNMCPKITFSYATSTILAKYTLTGINLKIISKTGNRSNVHQMDDFDDVRETKTMDKNSFGTCVVSNAENVISNRKKTFPSCGSVKLSSTELTITGDNAVIRLPSKVFKGESIKMFYTFPIGICEQGYEQNISVYNWIPYSPINKTKFMNLIISWLNGLGVQQQYVDEAISYFESIIDDLANQFDLAGTITFYEGNKLVPTFQGNSSTVKIEKGDNVPYLATIVENDSGVSPHDRTIIFCDKNTKELLPLKREGIAWERGSDLITGFELFSHSNKVKSLLYTDLQENKEIFASYNVGGAHIVQIRIPYYAFLDKTSNVSFVVNYVPMNDIKIKVDNQRDKRDIQLYNQNGKITDNVALSKLLNSYSKEISSDTITKYMHYYSYNDVPQVGDIVMDGNVEYVINNVSIDFAQNETSVSGEFGYFLDCEITMSKYVSTKSLMVNPNTNIRDYGIPQNYNVKRKQLYRDYYELSYYDDVNANLETPYLATSKIFNFNHYSNREDNFVCVIKIGYDDYVENSMYWYYQLETTNYYMNKMVYILLDFKDNNTIGYGSQNVFSGFDVSRIFTGLTDNINTPIEYTDGNGKVKDIDILFCDDEQITTIYDEYKNEQAGGNNYNESLYNYSVFIPEDIYLMALNNHTIRITEELYNKDALEVPVFEYVCQIDDSEYVLIGDNILQQYGSDFVYFYSYVYGDNINQNNAFTTTRVVADGVSGNCSISFASEFSYDPTNKELSVSIWNQSEYDPATNTWQYGTRQNFVRNKDYAIFRHAYNVNTGEEIIDLMLIAKKVQKDDSTNLVLKVNHYKLK